MFQRSWLPFWGARVSVEASELPLPGHTDGELVRERVRLALEARTGRSGCRSGTGATFLCSLGLTGLVSLLIGGS